MKTIVDLCGGTGAWSRPYAEAGYQVFIVDIATLAQSWETKGGGNITVLQYDICKLRADEIEDVHGVLFAPDCTHFSGSGAQYWPAKDADGRTAEAVRIVRAGLRLIDAWQPAWWALENPVGRLPRLVPELGRWKLTFQPHDYGDPWTKRTCLWGHFNQPAQRPVEPVRSCGQGSWLMKLGGKSDVTKRLRSATPPAFAQAFFEANP